MGKDGYQHRLLQQMYKARIVAYVLVFGCVLAATEFHTKSYPILLTLTGLFAILVPHLAHYFHKRNKDLSSREQFVRIEYNAVLFDNFYAGFCIVLCYFYPPIAFALFILSYANLLTVGGKKLLLKGAIALPLGVMLGIAVLGFEVHLENSPLLMVLSGVLITTFLFSIVIIKNDTHNALSSARKKVSSALKELKAETERSEELLLNILPAEIAEELRQKGKSDARNHDFASVLFTDFVGFTQISANYSAERIVRELDRCYDKFDQICEKYGIEKIKTIGDSYMAASGLHSQGGPDCSNIVMAALEMLQFIESRKEKHAEDIIPLKMRAGIHSGSLVSGIVGSKKFQFDIWGDTVNTASRMESNGVPGALNVSKSTLDSLVDDHQFEVISRGKIAAKGKGEVLMFLVSLKEN